MKLKIINKRPNRPQHLSLKGKEEENGKLFSIGATHCPLQEPRREVSRGQAQKQENPVLKITLYTSNSTQSKKSADPRRNA